MEHKIGKKFNYYGTTLDVVEQSLENVCAGCYFNSDFMAICYAAREIVGECCCHSRKDRTNVIFKEIKK